MKGKVLMIAFCIVLAVAIVINCKADVQTERDIYIVKAGDTIWDIYEEYAPRGISYDEYKYNIKRDNGLKTCDLYPNMILEIVKESK